MARRGCFMALGFDDSAQPTSLRVALCSPLGTALTTRGVTPMHQETSLYNRAQSSSDREICDLLSQVIDIALPEAENKVWHAHPVWFLDGNPVVGYSKLKGCVRLLFWSGQSFSSPGLKPEGKFKAAEARFVSVDQVDKKALRAWLAESREVQWDYKNIVRRKGKLERLK